MPNTEPAPDRRYGGDHSEQEPLGQLPDSEHDLWTEPSLTIAEAARTCGVSVSTIRRYLAAGRFPTAHQPPSPSPVSVGSGESRPRTCSPPACDHARPAYPSKKRRTSPRVAERSAGLVLTGFENSSTPWNWSGPAAEPPRTWPPSGPTRSRPWRAPFGRCKRITLPRRPTPTAPLPHQRHHLAPRPPPGQPSGQACCRWCRNAGRPSANSARRRRRPSSGGCSAGNSHPSSAGSNSAIEIPSRRRLLTSDKPGEGTRLSRPMASFRSRGQIRSR
jgi:predicted DNA-binding transcriptional regulator AlpA